MAETTKNAQNQPTLWRVRSPNSIIHLDPRFTVGMTVNWQGQTFKLVAINPYQRQDGRETIVLVWQSNCAVCGCPFETITPQRKFKYPTRRCAAHKKPRRNTTAPISASTP